MIKIGIAGYGIVGRRRHAVIDGLPDAKVVSACDICPDKIPETGVEKRYSSIDALLESGIDALIVSLSNDLAVEATLKGLRKGLHVFCEKPPARNLDELAHVGEALRLARDQVLMYGFNHRYHESVIMAKKLLDSSQMGKVLNARALYGKSKLVTFDQTDWRTKKEIAGGGVLLDQGIHMVDLLRYFLGELRVEYSEISSDFWGYDVEDNVYAVLRALENGAIVLFHSSATEWQHKFELELNCEFGSISLFGLLTSSKSYGEERLVIEKVDHSRHKGSTESISYKFNEDLSWERELKEFVACVKSKQAPKIGNYQDAEETLRLVDRIYELGLGDT